MLEGQIGADLGAHLMHYRVFRVCPEKLNHRPSALVTSLWEFFPQISTVTAKLKESFSHLFQNPVSIT